MGKRRSFPKARDETLVPGGYWRRLYSALSTIAITLFTNEASKPAAINSFAYILFNYHNLFFSFLSKSISIIPIYAFSFLQNLTSSKASS